MSVRVYVSEKALDDEVLFLLYQHIGRVNAVDRWTLVRKVYGDEAAMSKEDETDGNTFDRNVRDSIERWRPQGHFICNMGDGKGYFIAKDRKEYEDWKKYYLGPSFPKFQTINKVLDPKADERWGKTPKNPDPLPLWAQSQGG